MVSIAIFASPNEAKADCVALPGYGGGITFPVFKVKGQKVMMLWDTQPRTFFVTNSGDTPLHRCNPRLSYDKGKLTCYVKPVKKNLEKFIVASGFRVTCWAKSGDTQLEDIVKVYTGPSVIQVEVKVARRFDKLLAIAAGLRKDVNDNSSRIDSNTELAEDAKKTAQEASDRTSANMSLSIDAFYTLYHQGADIRYFNDKERFWPSGGVGLAYTYWFKRWDIGSSNQFSLGVTTRLRWHRLVLTIDGAPPDSDMPGDQYEMLVNLSGRLKLGRVVSFDLYGGGGPAFFSHEDHVSDPTTVNGPEHNVSIHAVLNFGGGINFHIKKFVVGINLMGALGLNALLHPNYEGDPRFGPVKHFYLGIKTEYTF